MIPGLWQRLTAKTPAPLAQDEVQLALAALMVRLARADDDYSAAEKQRIGRVLVQRFALSPAAADDLRAAGEAEEARAPDTVRFTRALKEAVPVEDRLGLVEALWSVALADGGRDAEEDRLMRLVVSLLGVTDVESGVARLRAQAAPGRAV